MTRALPLPVLVVALLLAGAAGLRADPSGPTGSVGDAAPPERAVAPEQGPADACANRGDVLGVSRVIEIDTTGGPRFGRPSPDTLLADKEVVLTFDDGPARRYTMPILEALDAECTKATFFVVGRMALADPETLKETARRGHTIGAHTWSHKRLDSIGATKATEEIELGYSAITLALGGQVAPFFRFPYLRESQPTRAHLAKRDLATFGIDVDSRDFLTRNPSVMRKTVMDQLAAKGKGIILFHDIQPATASGVASLLSELKAKGFKIVHLAAKAPASTIAAYDSIAQREAQKRRIALSTQPLANRSVVWPIEPGSPTPAMPGAVSGEELPWSKQNKDAAARAPVAAAAGPALPPPIRPRLKPRIDDDNWAVNPLGNY